ncbi:hypothetical protein PQ459_10250 [Chryseobacterium sp. KACC 21268]|nr:hypothetical protein PQ459_10250 [Chryseobacterium sp. KACC 21268]
MENGDKLIHSFNDSEHSQGHFEGLTKREYVAIAAMQGFIASNNGQSPEYLAKRSIQSADELLKQLETTQK